MEKKTKNSNKKLKKEKVLIKKDDDYVNISSIPSNDNLKSIFAWFEKRGELLSTILAAIFMISIIIALIYLIIYMFQQYNSAPQKYYRFLGVPYNSTFEICEEGYRKIIKELFIIFIYLLLFLYLIFS